MEIGEDSRLRFNVSKVPKVPNLSSLKGLYLELEVGAVQYRQFNPIQSSTFSYST